MDDREFRPALWSDNPAELVRQENCKFGTLSFSNDSGIDLCIPVGSILDDEPVDGIKMVGLEPLRRDFLTGFSQDGFYYVLREVVGFSPGFSAPGMEHQELSGESLLVGRKLIDQNPIVKSITVKLVGLREWLGLNPTVAHIAFTPDSTLDSISFEVNSNDINEPVLFENGIVKIAAVYCGVVAGSPIPQYQYEYTVDYALRISFFEYETHLDDALNDWVYPAIDFLGLCMGFLGDVKTIEFTIPNSQNVFQYYARLIPGTKKMSSSDRIQMPFPYRTLQDRIQETIKAWYSLEGYAKQAAIRAVYLRRENWKLPLDLMFLASSNAFEAASRVGEVQEELSEEEFDRRRQVIQDSVEDVKTKKWAARKLEHCNFVPAGNLTEKLLNKLEPFTDYVVPDKRRFLKEHRAARNSYTHLRDIEKPDLLEQTDLWVHTKAVQILELAAVLNMLGLEPSEILERFQESHYCFANIHRARMQYRLTQEQEDRLSH